MKKLLLIPLLFSILLEAQSFMPDPPELAAKSYILIEPNTNTVIAEFNSSKEIEPASMTKIMTAYVAADFISEGLFSLDDQVKISEKAWKMKGSRMFVEESKKVSVLDLLKGITIQSGNDASVAISEFFADSESQFANIMNNYAEDLGMTNTFFQNSTGLPAEGHVSSARDLAILTASFIKKFPNEYALFKEKEFTFNNIRQLNRNRLLWQDVSSDGVKTGHTDSAGFCLVGSAKKGDMRLITVVAGADSENSRFLSTRKLLNYGFRYYATQQVLNANEEYKNISIWGGQEKNLSLGVLEDTSITLARTDFKNLKVTYKYSNNIQAPISLGQKIGTLEISSNDKIVLVTDLVALQEVEAKGFFGRLWSKFVLWIYSLFGMTENGAD